MSKPTAAQLVLLRNWMVRKGALTGKALPMAPVPSSDTLAFCWALDVLDAYEATQRPIEIDPNAPKEPAALIPFWHQRRAALGKGPSVCAEELRRALEHAAAVPVVGEHVFGVGDVVRVTGDTQKLEHGADTGDEGVVTRGPNGDGQTWAERESIEVRVGKYEWWIHPRDLVLVRKAGQ